MKEKEGRGVSDSMEAKPAAPRQRLPFLDSARGLALIAMASYHFSWDLEFFGYLDPGTSTHGALKLYARAIASSFLFLAGFSLVLAHFPHVKSRPFLRRLGMVAAAAAAISAATWWFTPEAWIFFGILHAITLSSIIGLLFLRLPPIVTGGGAILAIALPVFARSSFFDSPPLWFLGLSESLPRSNDYVPLLPWIGALLAGIVVARLLVDRKALGLVAGLPAGPSWLQFAGRHSLAVYLLHQPVLIALLYGASMVLPPPAEDPVAAYRGSCEAACIEQGNDAALCTRFCACTLDRLQAQSLLQPLQSGAILPDQDARVLALAGECTAISRQSP